MQNESIFYKKQVGVFNWIMNKKKETISLYIKPPQTKLKLENTHCNPKYL